MDAPEVAVEIVTETELVKLPPFGVIVGVATVDTTIGAATVSVKFAVLVMPPPVALTVMEKLPVGVDPLVLILRTVEQVGLQEAEEKELVAPEGSPETTLNDTACVVPAASVALIVFLTETPATTETLAELLSVKSKSLVFANHALVSELAFALFLNALALINVSVESLMGPAYCVFDWSGGEPSTV